MCVKYKWNCSLQCGLVKIENTFFDSNATKLIRFFHTNPKPNTSHTYIQQIYNITNNFLYISYGIHTFKSETIL